MKGNILVVLPHPDDEAFGLSGSVAMYIQQGAHVTYACLTLGEMGRSMGNPIIASRVTLPAVRREELEASCRAIGIRDLRMMGFRDKTIEFEDQEQLELRIGNLIAELRPSLVMTFYPGYSVHPDHDACGAAVIRTIEKLLPEERPKVHCLAFSKGCEKEIGKPDIVNNVKAFVKQKVQSIEAHRSQFQLSELLGTDQINDKVIEDRFGTERFWTYRFPL